MNILVAGLASVALLVFGLCGDDGNGGGSSDGSSSGGSESQQGTVPPTVAQAVGQLVEVCSLMEQQAEVLVADKNEGLVDTSDELDTYQNAQNLYIEAKASFDGWIAELKVAIVGGGDVQQAVDRLPEVAEKGDKFIGTAILAHREFIESGTIPNIGAVLAGLIEPVTNAAVTIWQAYQEENRANQQAISDRLESVSCNSWPTS